MLDVEVDKHRIERVTTESAAILMSNKMKTNRAAAKRFRFTGSGKVKINRAFRRHILTKKSRKTKRKLRQPAYAAAVDVPRIRLLIPFK